LSLIVGGAVLAGVLRWRGLQREADRDALAILTTACEELERGDPTAAGRSASEAAAAAKTARTRNRALTVLAWAALGQGYPQRARAALDQIAPSHAVDLYCLAAVEAARGRSEFAIHALDLSRAVGDLTCEGAKLFVECHLRAFGIERAVMAALQTRKILGRENCELVLDAARDAGALVAAAKLAAALGHEANGQWPASPSNPSAFGPTSLR
jgi:hypothetical protein